MIECTITDNNTGKILSTNFQLTNDEINNNRTLKNLGIRGIYKITYIPTGQVYIGSSSNIQNRWNKHVSELNTKNHHSWKLQEVWDKEENKDNFKFEIIELVDKKTKLFDREQYWIDYYDAASHENFNILDKAGATFYSDDILNFRFLQEKKCGRFISFNMNTISELVEKLGNAGTVKFIFLCTYISKNNVLKLGDNNTYITKKNMRELLPVSKNIFFKFYKKVMESGLLILKDKHYYIDKKYSTKQQSKTNKKSTNYTRLYKKQIRELLINEKFTRALSNIFKMLPYINYTYNILCENPECDDINLINPLKAPEICKKIKYDHSNPMRLINKLMSYKINNEQILIFTEIPTINKKCYIINPKLVYKKANLQVFEKLLAIFENK